MKFRTEPLFTASLWGGRRKGIKGKGGGSC